MENAYGKLCIHVCAIPVTITLIGKLSEARKALTDAIAQLKSSLSKDNDFCKVSVHVRLVDLHHSTCCLYHFQGLVTDLKKCLDGMQTQDAYLSEGKLMVNSRYVVLWL